MADAVFVLGPDGRVATTNGAACRLLDYTESELVGKVFGELCIDASAGARSMQMSAAQTGDELRRDEIDLASSSGQSIPVSLVASALLDEDGYLDSIVMVARDLRETRRLVAELAAAKRDVEAKLAETEKQLIRAERLATVGTLAGGVVHELNNMAMVHMAAVMKLRNSAGDDPDLLDVAEDLDRVGEHISDHSRQLLRLARPGPDFVEPVDIGDIAGGTVAMLEGARKLRYVEVALELPESPVHVTVNRTRIEQILVNLIINAADAIDGQAAGRIRVRVELEPGAGRVACTVADNGSGIAADAIDSIFEPFFSTKAPGRGTGLGLAVARDIARSYGGDLSVLASAPGEGTTFRFDLPVS